METKLYGYSKCGTCKQAEKFLESNDHKFRSMPIVDAPPSHAELERMLAIVKSNGGSLKNLFNTSGVLYRELGIAEKIKSGMSEAEAIHLLQKNGKLIKRPFLLTKSSGAVGFNADVWSKLLNEGTR